VVPSVCRRIVVLLCAALLSVGALPLSAAHAQGAGDQQYSDPFGDSDSGSSNSGDNSGSGSGSGSGGSGSLTPAPQTSGGGSSSSGSGTSSSSGSGTSSSSGTGTATAAPAATLPNTGLDTRVLLIGGAVLVLFGVGLRLRNAPERF
jgi:hypothetical protein